MRNFRKQFCLDEPLLPCKNLLTLQRVLLLTRFDTNNNKTVQVLFISRKLSLSWIIITSLQPPLCSRLPRTGLNYTNWVSKVHALFKFHLATHKLDAQSPLWQRNLPLFTHFDLLKDVRLFSPNIKKLHKLNEKVTWHMIWIVHSICLPMMVIRVADPKSTNHN